MIIIYLHTFANGPEDLGSIPGRIIPKTSKIVFDTSLLNTQQYKLCIKDKVEQSGERSSALSYTTVVAIEKGAFWLPSTMVTFFYNVLINYFYSIIIIYLNTVIWFQVFLSNSINYNVLINYFYCMITLCLHTYGFKYSYPMLIIFKHNILNHR